MPLNYRKTLEDRALKLQGFMETSHGDYLKSMLIEVLNDALRDIRGASNEIQVARATGAADVCFGLLSQLESNINYAKELLRLQEEAMRAAQEEVPQEWRRQKAF